MSIIYHKDDETTKKDDETTKQIYLHVTKDMKKEAPEKFATS